MAEQEVTGIAMAIRRGIAEALKNVHTALPGIIDSFDPATQLAAVQPAIQRIFVATTVDGQTPEPVNLPQLINVPVVFPNAGGYALTFPVKQGDECLLVFCERSYDAWYEDGGVQPPSARRFHALSDAVAILGVNSKPNALTDHATDSVQLRNDDATATITIDDAQSVTIETTSGEVTCAADGGTITLRAPQVIIDGDFVCNGTMTNNGVNVGSTHYHPQGNDSGGDVQVPTGPPQ